MEVGENERMGKEEGEIGGEGRGGGRRRELLHCNER